MSDDADRKRKPSTCMTAGKLAEILSRLAPETRIYGDGTPRDQIFEVNSIQSIRFTRWSDEVDDDVVHEGICLTHEPKR